MSLQNILIEKFRSDAYWTYLEFCHATSEVPRPEVYEQIRSCSDTAPLERVTEWIKSNHLNYLKMMKKRESKKLGFWSRIFKF